MNLSIWKTHKKILEKLIESHKGTIGKKKLLDIKKI